jgi:hypothetical protein
MFLKLFFHSFWSQKFSIFSQITNPPSIFHLFIAAMANPYAGHVHRSLSSLRAQFGHSQQFCPIPECLGRVHTQRSQNSANNCWICSIGCATGHCGNWWENDDTAKGKCPGQKWMAIQLEAGFFFLQYRLQNGRQNVPLS